jgi:hypothetical protein
MASHLLDTARELIFGHSGRKPIPNLDGPWRANELLEESPLLGTPVEAPEDIASDDRGRVFVASGNRILVLDETAPGAFREFASFDGRVTAIAFGGRLGLVACVTGRGVVILDGGGQRTVSALESETSLCPTGVAVDPKGDVYVSVGSTRRAPDDWSRDLMELGRSGKILRYDVARSTVDVLADALAYPYGVAVRDSDGAVIVAEAWRHRVLVVSERRGTQPAGAAQNLPGYPSRLCRAGDGGWWVSFLALRTHLVEFVLREDQFRARMMETVRPEHWIAPALNPREALLQPLQLGGLRNHGIKKAWAPPRSYGLVVKFDQNFEPLSSLHSRSNGSRHGATGIVERGDRILVAMKGADCIVSAPTKGDA